MRRVYSVGVPLQEKALIARIRRAARSRGPGVVTGIGDDCAVVRIPAGHEVLVTTDFSLEGIHFRREWHTPVVVGWRCLARGLSDIAAMGGKPRAAFLSLAIPRKLPQRWVDGFLSGLLSLAKQCEVNLAGGDTAESSRGVLADIVVIGSVPRGKAILRSSATPGDQIYVTGQLGAASAALEQLYAGRRVDPQDFPGHFRPMPRVAVGEFVRKKRLASAMIDLSDGLSTDLAHICEESSVGAHLFAEAIPLATIGSMRVKPNHALHGGDDYELLFTVPRSKTVPTRIAGVPLTLIGEIQTRKGIFLIHAGGRASRLKPQGWEHFAR